jgi:hypothetical protein
MGLLAAQIPIPRKGREKWATFPADPFVPRIRHVRCRDIAITLIIALRRQSSAKPVFTD